MRWLIVLGLVTALAGCSLPERVEDGYGRQAGFNYGGSVNGTAVLADMFRQAGHKVNTWSVLSPRLERADIIVWFPDDFDRPSHAVRQHLEKWLARKPNRTLVYVGRHFDAEPVYWEKVGGAPPQVSWRLERAKERAEKERGAPKSPAAPEPDSLDESTDAESQEVRESAITAADSGWFRFVAGSDRRAKRLKGPWGEGVDAGKAEIMLTGKFVPRLNGETLLASGDDVVAFKAPLSSSQLILIQNGSFLLNYPLVNHEHRKLAGKLVETVDDASGKDSTVVFLESSRTSSGHGSAEDSGSRSSSGHGSAKNPATESPPIMERDPAATAPPGPEDQPPLSYVLYHAIVLGVIVVFAAWPIFGRPRRVVHESRSDFGRHVYWFGQLLEKTGDAGYCKNRVQQYQLTVRRDEPRDKHDVRQRAES